MKKVYFIATFVAIIAGIATFFFANSIQKNTKIENVELSPVVVAKALINENTVLTADLFEVKQFPTASVVQGAASKIEDVVNQKLNRYPLVAGEQVIAENLITIGGDDKNSRLSYLLKPGESAYTIDVDIVQGVAGFIKQGDFVDILHTGAVGEQIVTTLLMKDIKVLKVADYAANAAAEAAQGAPITSYGVVTLLLNETQVIEITQKMAVGRLKLVLKPVTTGQDTALAESDATQTAETTTVAN